MKKLLLLTVFFLVTGCASGPTSEQLSSADYGSYQSPETCVMIAEQRIKSGLKDPSSAMFNHNPCYKGHWSSVPIMGLPVAFGYLQNGTVNAKNSFGGYGGSTGYGVLIKNGRVIRWCLADENGICIPR